MLTLSRIFWVCAMSWLDFYTRSNTSGCYVLLIFKEEENTELKVYFHWALVIDRSVLTVEIYSAATRAPFKEDTRD